MLTTHEKTVLRELACRYAEIAALPCQAEKRRMWTRLNTIHMERPMVLLDQLPWNELDQDGSLTNEVTDPYWRGVETELRRALYQWEHFPVDRVYEPYLCLPRPLTDTGWGIRIQKDGERHFTENPDVSSSHYVDQIRSMEDIEKLHAPVITLDREKEEEIQATAQDIFRGAIDFKMTGRVMHLGIWDTIAMWMGVENCYIAIMDEPELIHALMRVLTDGLINMIGQLNQLQAFDVTSRLCHCSHTYLPDLPCGDEIAVSGNAWAFGMAQLFTSVSPRVTREFEVEYMKEVFPHFGAIYYGCCDRLDDRMDEIRQLPKIRKLSCSPWSDREHFAEVMPDNCVMSNKPSPAFVASGAIDEELVRKDIRRTIRAAKEYHRGLELILKDVSTVSYRPDALEKWARIAMEEAERE